MIVVFTIKLVQLLLKRYHNMKVRNQVPCNWAAESSSGHDGGCHRESQPPLATQCH